MKKIKEFFGHIKQELKKITWPTDKEMKTGTTQVFVFMIALSLFFAGIDAIVSTGVVIATRPTPIVVEEEPTTYPYEDEEVESDYTNADTSAEEDTESDEMDE